MTILGDEQGEDLSNEERVAKIAGSIGKSIANETMVVVELDITPYTPRRGCIGVLLGAPDYRYFMIKAHASAPLARVAVGQFFVDLEENQDFSKTVNREGLIKFTDTGSDCTGVGKYIVLGE